MSPHIEPIPMHPGAVLYRGLSDDELAAYDRAGHVVLRPREALQVEFSIGFHFAANQELATEQCMDFRRRFTSMSLSRDIALWYATSGGYQPGVLAICRAPAALLPERTSGAGNSLWVHVPDEDLAFFDARCALYASDVDAWQEGLNRALVDHEVLLVTGALQAVEIIEVPASACPRSVKPWVEWFTPARTAARERPPRKRPIRRR
jgi:hypothetical protein